MFRQLQQAEYRRPLQVKQRWGQEKSLNGHGLRWLAVALASMGLRSPAD